MRKSVVVITILTLLFASCTKQRKSNRTAPVLRSTAPTLLTTAAPETRATVSSSPSAVAATDQVEPSSAVKCTDDVTASEVAHRFVTTLIQGVPEESVPTKDNWVQVAAGGSVIGTTLLSEAAGRATVAVAVAFENPINEAITDPIGLRIVLTTVNDCWHVESLGYL
jgi:hypothetical protein